MINLLSTKKGGAMDHCVPVKEAPIYTIDALALPEAPVDDAEITEAEVCETVIRVENAHAKTLRAIIKGELIVESACKSLVDGTKANAIITPMFE